jgi:hypothetical protein
VEETVSIRAAYERFPIAIKGTFLLRGADGLPHQVRIGSARVRGFAAEGTRQIGVEPMVLEVAPTQETFVPFEISTVDLPSGWYGLECDVVVDGTSTVVRPGDPFASAWPRGSVRRGTVTIGHKTAGVAWETLECLGDSVRIGFAADLAPPLKLEVDGSPHPTVDVRFDDEAGRGSVLAYPVLRSHERLTIDVRGEAPIDVALP